MKESLENIENYYDFLGIDPNASTEQINEALNEKFANSNEDQFIGTESEEVGVTFITKDTIAKTLLDEEKRKKYDLKLFKFLYDKKMETEMYTILSDEDVLLGDKNNAELLTEIYKNSESEADNKIEKRIHDADFFLKETDATQIAERKKNLKEASQKAKEKEQKKQDTILKNELDNFRKELNEDPYYDNRAAEKLDQKIEKKIDEEYFLFINNYDLLGILQHTEDLKNNLEDALTINNDDYKAKILERAKHILENQDSRKRHEEAIQKHEEELKKHNFYALLNVTSDNLDDLEKHYKNEFKKHPENLGILTKAYNTLRDEGRKKLYDDLRKEQEQDPFDVLGLTDNKSSLLSQFKKPTNGNTSKNFEVPVLQAYTNKTKNLDKESAEHKKYSEAFETLNHLSKTLDKLTELEKKIELEQNRKEKLAEDTLTLRAKLKEELKQQEINRRLEEKERELKKQNEKKEQKQLTAEKHLTILLEKVKKASSEKETKTLKRTTGTKFYKKFDNGTPQGLSKSEHAFSFPDIYPLPEEVTNSNINPDLITHETNPLASKASPPSLYDSSTPKDSLERKPSLSYTNSTASMTSQHELEKSRDNSNEIIEELKEVINFNKIEEEAKNRSVSTDSTSTDLSELSEFDNNNNNSVISEEEKFLELYKKRISTLKTEKEAKGKTLTANDYLCINDNTSPKEIKNRYDYLVHVLGKKYHEVKNNEDMLKKFKEEIEWGLFNEVLAAYYGKKKNLTSNTQEDNTHELDPYFKAHKDVVENRSTLSWAKRKLWGEYLSKHEEAAINTLANTTEEISTIKEIMKQVLNNNQLEKKYKTQIHKVFNVINKVEKSRASTRR